MVIELLKVAIVMLQPLLFFLITLEIRKPQVPDLLIVTGRSPARLHNM